MPTVLRSGAYRFFFFSNEGSEFPHIHIERDDDYAKFGLSPIRLLRSKGFNSAELNKLRKLVEKQENIFKEKWNEHFSGKKRA